MSAPPQDFPEPVRSPQQPSLHPSGQVAVRRALPTDARTVATLLHDFNVEFATPTPSVDDFERRLVDQLARQDVRAWLAEADGEPVGLSLVTLRPSAYHDGGVACLEELYARPARRGTGVGTALVHELLRWAGELGVGEIQINVDEVDADARRFYERHGFTNLELTDTSESRMLLYLREL